MQVYDHLNPFSGQHFKGNDKKERKKRSYNSLVSNPNQKIYLWVPGEFILVRYLLIKKERERLPQPLY